MSVSGISSRIQKPSFLWASFSFAFCDFFPEHIVLEFPLAVEGGVAVLLGLMLLDLLGLLDLLSLAARSASLWRELSRDLKVLSVACVLSWGM